jgi:uncharacterized delta-60 repeat protein
LINSKWQRDTTFGIKGIATISIAGQSSNPNDIVVDADDNIVVAGDSDGDLAVVRFTAEGELDTTFGTGGFITESFASTASAVALDSEGNIVVSGVASNGNLLVARFTVSRWEGMKPSPSGEAFRYTIVDGKLSNFCPYAF